MHLQNVPYSGHEVHPIQNLFPGRHSCMFICVYVLFNRRTALNSIEMMSPTPSQRFQTFFFPFFPTNKKKKSNHNLCLLFRSWLGSSDSSRLASAIRNNFAESSSPVVSWQRGVWGVSQHNRNLGVWQTSEYWCICCAYDSICFTKRVTSTSAHSKTRKPSILSVVVAAYIYSVGINNNNVYVFCDWPTAVWYRVVFGTRWEHLTWMRPEAQWCFELNATVSMLTCLQRQR